jgi:hypothetical protein
VPEIKIITWRCFKKSSPGPHSGEEILGISEVIEASVKRSIQNHKRAIFILLADREMKTCIGQIEADSIPIICRARLSHGIVQ